MFLKNLLFFFLFLITTITFSQEKRILDLKIVGAEKTNESFLKSLLTIKEGAILDSISIEKDIVLLKRLPAVSHAYYQVFYSHDNFYNVFIHTKWVYIIIIF